MAGETSPLRLGARVCFSDRWQGRVTSLDIAEDWEVLNLTVASGMLFFANSVKLPFTEALRWSEDALYLSANSFKAFAREVHPVAAPSRPISTDTPTAHAGTKLAGLVISPQSRKATEVLISRGVGRAFRVPVSQVVFDGKTLTLGFQTDNLAEFRSDDEILRAVKDAISGDSHLTPDDKSRLDFRVENGIAYADGNLRVRPTRNHVEEVLSRVPGVLAFKDEIIDDITLETNIGLALDRAGIARQSGVYARSNLGEVVLYGHAPSPRVVDDIVREVVKTPGVRHVTTKLETPEPEPTPA